MRPEHGQYRAAMICKSPALFQRDSIKRICKSMIGLSRRPRAERCDLRLYHRHGRRWAIAAEVRPVKRLVGYRFPRAQRGDMDAPRPWRPSCGGGGLAKFRQHRRKLYESRICKNCDCLIRPKAVHTPALHPQKACRADAFATIVACLAGLDSLEETRNRCCARVRSCAKMVFRRWRRSARGKFLVFPR